MKDMKDIKELKQGPWTQFMDMHSGGGSKEKWEYIYIQAPEKEAEIIFYNRFGHSPYRVTCTCCGQDYSVTESETLDSACAYNRGCAWEEGEYVEKQGRFHTEYLTVEEYLKKDNVLVIPASEIKDEERVGKLPQQGYVWVD